MIMYTKCRAASVFLAGDRLLCQEHGWENSGWDQPGCWWNHFTHTHWAWVWVSTSSFSTMWYHAWLLGGSCIYFQGACTHFWGRWRHSPGFTVWKCSDANRGLPAPWLLGAWSGWNSHGDFVGSTTCWAGQALGLRLHRRELGWKDRCPWEAYGTQGAWFVSWPHSEPYDLWATIPGWVSRGWHGRQPIRTWNSWGWHGRQPIPTWDSWQWQQGWQPRQESQGSNYQQRTQSKAACKKPAAKAKAKGKKPGNKADTAKKNTAGKSANKKKDAGKKADKTKDAGKKAKSDKTKKDAACKRQKTSKEKEPAEKIEQEAKKDGKMDATAVLKAKLHCVFWLHVLTSLAFSFHSFSCFSTAFNFSFMRSIPLSRKFREGREFQKRIARFWHTMPARSNLAWILSLSYLMIYPMQQVVVSYLMICIPHATHFQTPSVICFDSKSKVDLWKWIWEPPCG